MSSSSKQRTSSPFRFHKSASINGKLPGHSPSASSITSNFTASSSNPTKPSGTGSLSGTPTGRVRLPPPTPQILQLPSSHSSLGSGSSSAETTDRFDLVPAKAKENVTVTVRFRPLSSREIQKGDEIAWYADGDVTVRSEFNSSTGYGFDRVFGPATTTRHVYDVAARHVVEGAMHGINGTVFAYGVTSSGKTHTMHGDQKSPGIIPLAVKDVFSTIQETPGREFLLRVSYLEIYNEVINDLLDPAGQNLRVREDAQGTYVEGIKEEVVLSPAHCLSLIATGEEHRHVGSNNFNLLSSRSHTIFTLTVESSPRGDNFSDEEVTLSQLNLIDLAGSESSKTETTGIRRKEGAYINKSLLTLGTVISKLTDGKATHVPYRDSKLTRLLQSSLSGHGRVSLICTVTPSSSNSEETHNTLKFAHRAKHVEIHASQNKIMDEKSLIKKYQKEIQSLKHELEQVKRGIVEPNNLGSQDHLASLKQQLEAGQVKLQSRLEEEEQAKAALLGRIQRLTKLILVSTKTTASQNLPERQGNRRRHSFGEEELAYLPDRKREFVLDEEDGHDSEMSDGRSDNIIADDSFKGEKKMKRRSMLAWFKMKKNEHNSSAASSDLDNSSNASSSMNAMQLESGVNHRNSVSHRVDEVGPLHPFFGSTQAGELFSATVRGRRPPPTGTTMADQMDLLREQVKMLAGEVAFCTSSLKRLSEQVAVNPNDIQLQAQMQSLKDEIQEKRRQMRVLERRIVGNGEAGSNNGSALELSQKISKLSDQLNEKTFELELKTADNRILQEQLQAKIAENMELQTTIATLREQLSGKSENSAGQNDLENHTESHAKTQVISEDADAHGECSVDRTAVTAKRDSQINAKLADENAFLQSRLLQQAMEIEKLKQESDHFLEEKDALQVQSRKLAEESSYAKELASAAAVELKNLAEEVTKLSYQNTKLAAELANAQELARARSKSGLNGMHSNSTRQRLNSTNSRRFEEEYITDDLKRELLASREREASLEAKLAERELRDAKNQKKIEEGRKREADLENDLAGMWVLVAKLKKERLNGESTMALNSTDISGELMTADDPWQGKTRGTLDAAALKRSLEKEKQRTEEVEALVSQLKIDGLKIEALEDIGALHVQG